MLDPGVLPVGVLPGVAVGGVPRNLGRNLFRNEVRTRSASSQGISPNWSLKVLRMFERLYEAGKNLQAEDEIIAWFQEDTINRFAIVRAKRFNKAGNRWHQLREALKLTFEERYWSAVPLILIACDGFASDVLGTSPFEKDADLTAFDSITGHSNSLPAFFSPSVIRSATDVSCRST